MATYDLPLVLYVTGLLSCLKSILSWEASIRKVPVLMTKTYSHGVSSRMKNISKAKVYFRWLIGESNEKSRSTNQKERMACDVPVALGGSSATILKNVLYNLGGDPPSHSILTLELSLVTPEWKIIKLEN